MPSICQVYVHSPGNYTVINRYMLVFGEERTTWFTPTGVSNTLSRLPRELYVVVVQYGSDVSVEEFDWLIDLVSFGVTEFLAVERATRPVLAVGAATMLRPIEESNNKKAKRKCAAFVCMARR